MTGANKSAHPDVHQDVERLLPRRELRRLVPVSDMTIWRWERAGEFPQHIAFNGRNYWLLSEVRAWVTRRRAAGVSADRDQ